jgi:hypothetical protein
MTTTTTITTASSSLQQALASTNNILQASNIKQLKNKKFIELREREDFLHKLKEFHKIKG